MTFSRYASGNTNWLCETNNMIACVSRTFHNDLGFDAIASNYQHLTPQSHILSLVACTDKETWSCLMVSVREATQTNHIPGRMSPLCFVMARDKRLGFQGLGYTDITQTQTQTQTDSDRGLFSIQHKKDILHQGYIAKCERTEQE